MNMTEEEFEKKQQKLLNLVSDAVSCLLYYDRKEDDELSPEEVDHVLTEEQIIKMVKKFEEELRV